MSVGLNFVLGADVAAFGFQKSISFQLIPVPGVPTCKQLGSDLFPLYNLKTNVDEFMMLTPMFPDPTNGKLVGIPCIGATSKV